jgi:hypothetical protein
MGFVKANLACAVSVLPMPWLHKMTPCSSGIVEADHAGPRGLSQKSVDGEVIPMCATHHRERTAHMGVFWHATKAELREWLPAAIAATKTAYEESR